MRFAWPSLLILATLGSGARAEPSLCQKWLERFLFVTQPEDLFALNATRLDQIEAQRTITEEMAKLPGVLSHLDSAGRYTSFVYSDNKGTVEAPELRTIKMFIVDAIAPPPTSPSEAWLGMPFMDHPDSPATPSKIQSNGYALAIDPALSLTQKRSNGGGYFIPRQRLIGVHPKTSYKTLQHEYAHLLFEEAVISPFLRSESFARYAAAQTKANEPHFQETSHEFAERLADWLTAQESLSESQSSALRMYAKSIRTTSALTETFATDADLRLMDEYGVGQYFITRNAVRKYQTYTQLADLESRFETLSTADRRLWAKLKWRSAYLRAAIELQLQWYRIPYSARRIFRVFLPILPLQILVGGAAIYIHNLPVKPTTQPANQAVPSLKNVSSPTAPAPPAE